jgi:hypothetical protein
MFKVVAKSGKCESMRMNLGLRVNAFNASNASHVTQHEGTRPLNIFTIKNIETLKRRILGSGDAGWG